MDQTLALPRFCLNADCAGTGTGHVHFNKSSQSPDSLLQMAVMPADAGIQVSADEFEDGCRLRRHDGNKQWKIFAAPAIF